MNIFCVTGCSVNAFYVNYLKGIKNCSLLIFNFTTFKIYSFLDILNCIEEIKIIHKVVNCSIIAGIKYKSKKYIIFYNKQLKIKLADDGIKLKIHNTKFFIASTFVHSKCLNTIFLAYKRIKLIPNYISKNKRLWFLHKNGVIWIKNKKLYTKLQKCSKFILK